MLAAPLPRRTVSGDEFMALAIRHEGWTPNEAELQERVCRILRSEVRIGQELLRIVQTCGHCQQPKEAHDLYTCGRCKRLFGPCCLDKLDVGFCASCAPGVRAMRGPQGGD